MFGVVLVIVAVLIVVLNAMFFIFSAAGGWVRDKVIGMCCVLSIVCSMIVFEVRFYGVCVVM